jgi:hypothetical protein
MGIAMKKSTIVKLVVQAVGCGFGLLGLAWFYLGIEAGVTGIRDSDPFFFMTPMFLLFGGVLIAVAWRTLRRFGPTAIKNVVGLVAFSAYIAVSTFLERFQEAAREKGDLYLSALSFIPLLFAFLLYRVLSRKLIEMTETNTSNNGLSHATDPPGPAPTSD